MRAHGLCVRAGQASCDRGRRRDVEPDGRRRTLRANVARGWGLEQVSPFKDIEGLFLLPDYLLEAGAALLRVESEGSCLTTANLALWRENGATLPSVQKGGPPWTDLRLDLT